MSCFEIRALEGSASTLGSEDQSPFLIVSSQHSSSPAKRDKVPLPLSEGAWCRNDDARSRATEAPLFLTKKIL